jgi:GntR family transcriptional repressor for pyruvate dehydrogenase complex
VSIDERLPAYRVLADELRARITSGQLRAGDRLPTEPQLCRSSGVSRSTVREALRLLASEHLIVTTRGVAGGSFVAHPSAAQLSATLATGVRLMAESALVRAEDILEVRALVDVPATELAAIRHREQHVEAMRAALFDPLTAELDWMVTANSMFHTVIAEACGNPVLELLTKPLHSVGNARQLLETRGREFWIQLDADHRAIFEAIVARSASGARAAAERHVANLRSHVPARDGMPSNVLELPVVAVDLSVNAADDA